MRIMDAEEQLKVRLTGPDGDPDAQAMWRALCEVRAHMTAELGLAKMLGSVDQALLTRWRETAVQTPMSGFTQCSASYEKLRRDMGADAPVQQVARMHHQALIHNLTIARNHVLATVDLCKWLTLYGYKLAVEGESTGAMHNIALHHRALMHDRLQEASEAAARIRTRIQRLETLKRLGAMIERAPKITGIQERSHEPMFDTLTFGDSKKRP